MIFEVFKIFFRNVGNVAIYFCDTQDKRQQTRHRKFSLWFWRYNDGSIIKEDAEATVSGAVIYNSIMVHKTNPFLQEIINAFKELNEEDENK